VDGGGSSHGEVDGAAQKGGGWGKRAYGVKVGLMRAEEDRKKEERLIWALSFKSKGQKKIE
jgi:hypothetical protein